MEMTRNANNSARIAEIKTEVKSTLEYFYYYTIVDRINLRTNRVNAAAAMVERLDELYRELEGLNYSDYEYKKMVGSLKSAIKIFDSPVIVDHADQLITTVTDYYKNKYNAVLTNNVEFDYLTLPEYIKEKLNARRPRSPPAYSDFFDNKPAAQKPAEAKPVSKPSSMLGRILESSQKPIVSGLDRILKPSKTPSEPNNPGLIRILNGIREDGVKDEPAKTNPMLKKILDKYKAHEQMPAPVQNSEGIASMGRAEGLAFVSEYVETINKTSDEIQLNKDPKEAYHNLVRLYEAGSKINNSYAESVIKKLMNEANSKIGSEFNDEDVDFFVSGLENMGVQLKRDIRRLPASAQNDYKPALNNISSKLEDMHRDILAIKKKVLRE